MKKFLVFSIAAMALSSVSSAAVITQTCGSLQQLIVAGAAPVAGSNTCAAFDAGAGSIITSITLQIAGDAQFVITAPASISINFTPGGAGSAFGNQSMLFTGGTQFGGLTTAPLSPVTLGTILTPNTQTFAGFSVGINAVVNTGNVDSASGRVIITYNTQDVQGPEVPEPSTFIMLGTALTGLGIFARRRKA